MTGALARSVSRGHNVRMRPLSTLLLLIALAAPARAATPLATAPGDSSFLEQFASTFRFRHGQPNSVKITPEGDAILFLRSGPRSFVQDLWVYETDRRRERVLLTAESILRGAEEKLSPEEKARRERQRQTARGIASYELSKDGRRILVPLAGRLFVIERSSGDVKELKGAKGDPIDPQLSPDGTQVACVRDGDIYVTDIPSGEEHRLTTGATETLTHGLAEFCAQEEMDRFSGYWWSPDSRFIAYEEADLSPVEALHIMDPTHPEQEPEAWRFPRVGTRNADARLGVIAAAGGATTWVRWDKNRYPYLATVRWSEGAPLTILVQNRKQTEELLLEADPKHGGTNRLLVERDAAWVNLDQDLPRWLKDGSGFLWTTERSGGWQLELHNRKGGLVRVIAPPSINMRALLDVDDDERVAWVSGGSDPTQVQIYHIPLDSRRGDPQLMTHEPGIHGMIFGRNHRVRVHGFENPETPPVARVETDDGAVIGELTSVAERPSITPHLQFVTVGSRHVHGVIMTPEGYDPRLTYPVVVSVYGGPHVQVVMQARNRYLLDQWLANQGFIVVSFDGRGTPARGRAWERTIKNNLIDVPLNDQVEALQALGREMPQLDLSRVGIYGWSFGGYFSAMAAMRRPDVFRAGVAGAPVADFRDYDTHYTERYMGLLNENLNGYKASSVLTYAPKLERPLLIVHGTSDDNVYFLHSLKLCDALFRAGKPFEFVPLAGFTHMVPDPLVTDRLYGRVADFLERNVAGNSATGAASISRR